jgi:hypothetical protein
MSAAALTYVEEWSHGCLDPRVMRSARTLMRVIAQRIPEGETTTPLIGMDALADLGRVHRRTVVSQLQLLADLGEIQVIDGGQGRVARYALVHLNGARPITAAPLPLIGAAAPPRAAKPRIPPSPSSPTLFDLAAPATSPGDQRAINLCNQITSWLRRRLQPVISRLVLVISDHKLAEAPVQPVISDHKFPSIERSDSEKPVISDHKLAPLSSSREDLVVGDARAREPADDFLDWFEATYPTVHHGAVCTVLRTRDGPLVRELLQRPGTDVTHLQAMTRALWAITTDGVRNSDRSWIAEKVTVRGIVVLHRKADFLDQEVRRAGVAPVAVELDAEDLATYATLFRDAIEPRLTRRDLEIWIKPLAVVPEEDRVVLCAPSEIHATYIRKNFGEAIEAATQTAFHCSAEVIVRALDKRSHTGGIA